MRVRARARARACVIRYLVAAGELLRPGAAFLDVAGRPGWYRESFEAGWGPEGDWDLERVR